MPFNNTWVDIPIFLHGSFCTSSTSKFITTCSDSYTEDSVLCVIWLSLSSPKVKSLCWFVSRGQIKRLLFATLGLFTSVAPQSRCRLYWLLMSRLQTRPWLLQSLHSNSRLYGIWSFINLWFSTSNFSCTFFENLTIFQLLFCEHQQFCFYSLILVLLFLTWWISKWQLKPKMSSYTASK